MAQDDRRHNTEYETAVIGISMKISSEAIPSGGIMVQVVSRSYSWQHCARGRGGCAAGVEEVTKDIQMYLRRQAQGLSQDKTTSIEKEIQLLREFFDKAMFDAETHLRDLDNKIEKTLKANRELDGRVIDLNVDVNEQNLKRDTELEVKNAEGVQRRMSVIVKRSQLITKIQEQYNDILVMQTELELLRLKTFPTLKYKTLF
uniref:Uncharacterized protein n=1 Tax=Timema cristinae TaxID=61476 RepID=A0A7R9GRK1_TIMCR|nr:unnamed protein product [Timema cristinae]